MSAEAYFASIALEQLVTNNYNARRFEENMTPQREARFRELVASVSEKGVIEPLLVRPLVDGRFEVIAGERRFRAARKAADRFGDSTGYLVPCMVRDVNDDEAFDLMVIENLQREDLTPLETAQAFKAYLQRYGNTAEAVAEISARTGIPGHAIRRQIRMLELPAEVLAAWRDGALSTSHVELLTRIGDPAQVMELFSLCQRNKLTVRDLNERIGLACPELDRGFFDKTECQTCQFNTAVQSGLFADATAGAKCGHSVCFEGKQSAFLTDNWLQGKAAKMFGTRGFRFGHRLGQEQREPLTGKETAQRCLECDVFVSILRLTGAVVSGYECVCTGPRKCFEELYLKKSPTPELEKTVEPQAVPPCVDEKSEPAAKISPSSAPAPQTAAAKAKGKDAQVKTKPAAPAEETGPVFNAIRGEKAREDFLKSLPGVIKKAEPSDPQVLRLVLLMLAASSSNAKRTLREHLGIEEALSNQDLAAKIYDDMLVEEVCEALQMVALAQLMDATMLSVVRLVVAENFGLQLKRNWTINRNYLDSLSKSELIRIGEEPAVAIWSDPKVDAYRQKHHKGKALHSLSKEALVDIVLKSGADLVGKVPEEVLGSRKG